ncbi:LacI family DNA-binding transcriptional regulator [Martelella soudanensis]|uniref:LacI family DNA-binding transcriptional regulator n=1 Tax=unclassified Martelella TaxID=2629616 RepID=UPI0015DE779A|nr:MULTISPECIES: LacI family DNA-binding transcriptional regulator [unclassified Martelella]
MSKPAKVTLIEVAKRAGVSPATVSNAINSARYVDTETKKRVDRAIADLGYVPNLKARRLRTGKANAIAVFSSMPFSISAGPSRLGFMMEIAASAAVAALEKRLSLVLVPPLPVNDPGFDHLEADGAIVIEPSIDDPHIAELMRRGVPTVAIGRPGPGFSNTVPYIDLQPKVVTEKVIRHFLETGASSPALFIGKTNRAAFHETETAYRRLAQETGFEPVVAYLDEADGEEAGHQATLRILDSRPGIDALFVLIDTFATGAVRALNERGIAMPDRMRVATRYDGLRARESTPRLTAFNLHLDEIARLALAGLMRAMEGDAQPLSIKGPEPEIVVRESSARSKNPRPDC